MFVQLLRAVNFEYHFQCRLEALRRNGVAKDESRSSRRSFLRFLNVPTYATKGYPDVDL